MRVGEIASAGWSMKLGEIGSVVEGAEDVEQCIRILLTTPKGSVPHRPHFGCDVWAQLGRPIMEARPRVVREVVDAVERWEPRATIRNVRVEVDESDSSALLVSVVFHLRETPGDNRTVSVRLA